MAFKLLLERSNKKLRLAIVGYGSEAVMFQDLSKELGLAHNVDFLGKQKGQQLLRSNKKIRNWRCTLILGRTNGWNLT